MSSSRKRAAIAKANREVDHLKQKLMLTEHHLSVMSTMAKLTAIKHNEKQLEVYKDNQHVATFPSLSSTVKTLNLNLGNVGFVLDGIRKQSGGYFFKRGEWND